MAAGFSAVSATCTAAAFSLPAPLECSAFQPFCPFLTRHPFLTRQRDQLDTATSCFSAGCGLR